MAEYIEREPLLAEYDRKHEGPPGKARELIENAPAADVQPVRHGLWAELRVGDIGQAEQIVLFGCSECGVTSWYATPFCGHCGARMGGSNER